MNGKVRVRDPFTGQWAAALLLRKGRLWTVQLVENGQVLSVPSKQVRAGKRKGS